MIKMYDAEVLSKFPVVQHFPFGSLFSWEHDPNAAPPISSVHTANQPSNQPSSMTATAGRPYQNTPARWAATTTYADNGSTNAVESTGTAGSSQSFPPTRAPWAAGAGMRQIPQTSAISPPNKRPDVSTMAPWARKSDGTGR
jgi:serine/threonine-protein phosphatase 2A activator